MNATTFHPTMVDSNKLSDSELETWNRNMSTDRTLYTPTLDEGASTNTAKDDQPNRSLKEKFKLVFRRKKSEDQGIAPKASKLRKKQSSKTLRSLSLPESKRSTDTASTDKARHMSLDKSGRNPSIDKPRKHSKVVGVGKDAQGRYTLDKDTGEYIDHTNMLHALAHSDSMDSLVEFIEPEDGHRPPGEPMVASLSPQIWKRVTDQLTLADICNLAFTSKTLLDKIGIEPWRLVNLPYARKERESFLLRMDRALPGHLYCPLCEIYHVRTQRGKESLKPTTTLNPLFRCAHTNSTPPRTRVASGRTLPFTFVQLVLRAHRFGPEYGVTFESLARRWKEPETGWSHSTLYRVHKGHLLMRVVSQKYAEGGMVEAAKRGFFYNMYEDFTPYFSVCSHWRDGNLMPACKCAVDHIPEPKYSIKEAHKMHQTALPQKPRIVALCGNCQPMRRCPECPSEYLIEAKLVEDQKDPVYKFKQSLVVTRWCDLGDGTTPANVEWAAINGQAYYSSIIEIGRRAISGIFESKTSNDNLNIPGQRIISMNPKDEHKGEDGDTWY